jgi:hypothetical protein
MRMAQQLAEPPDVCERCNALGLVAVIGRQKKHLEKHLESGDFRDKFLDCATSDGAAMVQRVLFDVEIPLDSTCYCCKTLLKACEPGITVFDDPHSTDTLAHAPELSYATRGEMLVNRRDDKIWSLGYKHEDTFGVPTKTPPGYNATCAPHTIRSVPVMLTDYTVLRKWVKNCDDNHIGCAPSVTPELSSIKLIDVSHRTLIDFPQAMSKVQYAALSYVWGSVPMMSFTLGGLPAKLPRTVEDALLVTKSMDIAYLWIDYVCIDQHDTLVKQQQIGIMDAIYSAAYVTLIVSDGHSADEGIPRVSTAPMSKPQAQVGFGRGNVLKSRMRSLQGEINSGTHSKRAWTFQELILSRRRIFFTRRQAFFSCRVSEHCEVLFESIQYEDGEGGPNTRPVPEHLTDMLEAQPMTGQRDVYKQLVMIYVYRKMSVAADALNAFAGVLSRLRKSIYPKGFMHGLPKDELRARLCWLQDVGSYDLVFQQRATRRYGFPSWSWLGWAWEKPARFVWKQGHERRNPCHFCCLPQPPLTIQPACQEQIYRVEDTTCSAQTVEVLSDADIMVMNKFLESLPHEDLKTGKPMKWPPGQTEISGIIIRIPVVHTRVKHYKYDYDKNGTVGRVLDELRIDEDFVNETGMIPPPQISFDEAPRKVVTQENTSTVVDFLLVAWTAEHPEHEGMKDDSDVSESGLPTPVPRQTSECSAHSPADSAPMLRVQGGDPSHALAAQINTNLTVSLLLLKWQNGVASRAGFLQFRVRLKDFSAVMRRLRPIKTSFVMS